MKFQQNYSDPYRMMPSRFCIHYVSKSGDTTTATGLEVLVTQSYPTLCDPTNCSLPDSSVPGILQERILEWIAISFSRDLPNPGVEPGSPALQADPLLSEVQGRSTLSCGLKKVSPHSNSQEGLYQRMC